MTATQCTHPYEEGMLGSFPYIRLQSQNNLEFEAKATSGSQEGQIRLVTNMEVTARVEYTNSSESGWINGISTKTVNDTVKVVTFDVSDNLKRSERSARISILADYNRTDLTIRVMQEAYDATGTSATHKGDLTLSSQQEVDECIYTKITGDLIISGDDIRDLSTLEYIKSIKGNLVIESCESLYDLGPLGDLEVEGLILSDVHAEPLLEKYTGTFENLTIENSKSDVDLSIITRFTDMTTLTLLYTEIRNLASLASLTSLEEFHISKCNVCEAEINYLRAMMSDTEIETGSLNGSDWISVDISSADNYTALGGIGFKFENYPTIVEIGYILSESSELDFESRNSLAEWTYDYISLTLEGIDFNTTYHIWAYAITDDGRAFISEATQFSTPERTAYAYFIYPISPSGERITEFSALMVYEYGGWVHIMEKSFTNTEDNYYMATMTEGQHPLMFYASESGAKASELTQYYTFGYDGDIYSGNFWIMINDDSGAAHDLITDCRNQYFTGDATEDLQLRRPVAAINLSASFPYGEVYDIAGISIELGGLYSQYFFTHGKDYYNGSRTHTFQLPADSKTAAGYVFPHNTMESRNVIISLTFNDGTTLSSSTTLDTEITAGNSYNITFPLYADKYSWNLEIHAQEISVEKL